MCCLWPIFVRVRKFFLMRTRSITRILLSCYVGGEVHCFCPSLPVRTIAFAFRQLSLLPESRSVIPGSPKNMAATILWLMQGTSPLNVQSYPHPLKGVPVSISPLS